MSLQKLTQPGQASNANFDYCQFSRTPATLLNNHAACQLSAAKKTAAKITNSFHSSPLSLSLPSTNLLHFFPLHCFLFNCRLFKWHDTSLYKVSQNTVHFWQPQQCCDSKSDALVIIKMLRTFRCNIYVVVKYTMS